MAPVGGSFLAENLLSFFSQEVRNSKKLAHKFLVYKTFVL